MIDQTALLPLVERASNAYELALELSALLDDLSQLEPRQPLMFSLSRMAERATLEADVLHCELLRLSDAAGRQEVEGQSS